MKTNVSLFTVVQDAMSGYRAKWLLPGETTPQWFHWQNNSVPVREEWAKQDILREKPDAIYLPPGEFALALEVRQLQESNQVLTGDNEDLERQIEALQTMLVALCTKAQAPLHVTGEEYEVADPSALCIEDDEETRGVLISICPASAGARMNRRRSGLGLG